MDGREIQRVPAGGARVRVRVRAVDAISCATDERKVCQRQPARFPAGQESGALATRPLGSKHILLWWVDGIRVEPPRRRDDSFVFAGGVCADAAGWPVSPGSCL